MTGSQRWLPLPDLRPCFNFLPHNYGLTIHLPKGQFHPFFVFCYFYAFVIVCFTRHDPKVPVLEYKAFLFFTGHK